MTVRRQLQVAAPAVAGLVLLIVVFPRVTGAGWGATVHVLASISVLELLLLAAVWFAGLCCYTFVLRASLPGLTVPQALTLNLGGSAVSNLVPFGGALGVGLNFAMARSWGFRRTSFATFTALTTAANVVAKLVLPLVVLLVVSATGQVDSPPLVVCAQVAGGLLVLVGLLVVFSATNVPPARLLVRLQRRGLAWLVARRRGAHVVAALRLRLAGVVAETRSTVRLGWQRLGVGMVTYLTLQALLLWMIFVALHSNLSLADVLVGFALERALTLVVVTPGGVGIAQTGAAAALIALGGDPTLVAAGIVLYSVFTFFVEIPVGAAATLGWWMLDRASVSRPRGRT